MTDARHTKIKAQFMCVGNEPSYEGSGDKKITLVADIGPGSEDFTKYTPWGDIRFGITKEATTAQRTFLVGKRFKVTFEEIPHVLPCGAVEIM